MTFNILFLNISIKFCMIKNLFTLSSLIQIFICYYCHSDLISPCTLWQECTSSCDTTPNLESKALMQIKGEHSNLGAQTICIIVLFQKWRKGEMQGRWESFPGLANRCQGASMSTACYLIYIVTCGNLVIVIHHIIVHVLPFL